MAARREFSTGQMVKVVAGIVKEMQEAEWRKSVTVVSPLVQSRRQHSRKMALNLNAGVIAGKNLSNKI